MAAPGEVSYQPTRRWGPVLRSGGPADLTAYAWREHRTHAPADGSSPRTREPTSEILRRSQGVGDLLHLCRSRKADPCVEPTTQDGLDRHDVRETVCPDPRREQRLRVSVDQMHAQDGRTVALVEEVRAHDQSQKGLTWTLKHGSIPPDLSSMHPLRVPEADHSPMSRPGIDS